MEMSLDDIAAKMKRKSNNNNRPNKASKMGRMNNRNRNRNNNSFPYQKRRDSNRADMDDKWRHDRFDGEKRDSNQKRDLSPVPEYGHKIEITNLNYDVLEEDLRSMFRNNGTLLAVKIFYDTTSRSEECAEVVFVNHDDAQSAIKEFNDRSMKGKPLSITYGGRATVKNGIILANQRDNRGGGFRNRGGGGRQSGGGGFRRNNNRSGGRNNDRGDGSDDNFRIKRIFE